LPPCQAARVDMAHCIYHFASAQAQAAMATQLSANSAAQHYHASLLAMCAPCAPPPGLEDVTPLLDDVTTKSSAKAARKATRNIRNRKPTVGMYVGIRNRGCSREECQVTSRKTGDSYQICHACVTEIFPDGDVKVHYVDHERSDETLPWVDIQNTSDKDMKWCEHGRICNHMLRSGKCDKLHDEKGSKRRFCHDLVCADRERCTKQASQA